MNPAVYLPDVAERAAKVALVADLCIDITGKIKAAERGIGSVLFLCVDAAEAIVCICYTWPVIKCLCKSKHSLSILYFFIRLLVLLLARASYKCTLKVSSLLRCITLNSESTCFCWA